MRACKRCLDHYWTLGLTQSATEAEIKHAFLELAKTHDFNKGDASTFAKIAEAHEILTEKASKYDYDRGIENHSDGARAQPAQETPSDGVFAQPAQVHETPSGFKRPKAGGGPLDDFGEFGVQHHGGEYTDYSRNEPEEVPVETPEHYALKVRSQRDATGAMMDQRQEKVNVQDRLVMKRAQCKRSAPGYVSPLSCAIC